MTVNGEARGAKRGEDRLEVEKLALGLKSLDSQEAFGVWAQLLAFPATAFIFMVAAFFALGENSAMRLIPECIFLVAMACSFVQGLVRLRLVSPLARELMRLRNELEALRAYLEVREEIRREVDRAGKPE